MLRLLSATFGLSLLLLTSLAQAETLIGYVDLQKAISSVEEGKRARARVEKEYNAKQAALEAQEAELMKLQGSIEQAMKANDPTVMQQQQDFQRRIYQLEQTRMKEQQELQKMEYEELEVITGKMRKLIEEIGVAGKYSLILEVKQNRLLFGKDYLDITNEVIRKYNSTYK